MNGRPARASFKLKCGDAVEFVIDPPADVDIAAQDIPLDIVYEDGSIVVVNKPKGMVVHPAPGNESGTLVNALMYHIKDLSGIGGELRPGIVHRIDKLTSGLIVVAKNDNAHLSLARQFKLHTARRTYIALVQSNIREDSGTVDAPIGRDRRDRKRMAVTPDGRSAITHFSVLYRFGDSTLVACELETGRTHQIRVHMAYIKHPLVGDTVYGGSDRLYSNGQALHAGRLSLTHPETGEQMEFFAPLPDWFTALLGGLGLEDAQTLINSAYGIKNHGKEQD